MASFGTSRGFANRSIPIPKFGVSVLGDLREFSEVVNAKVKDAAYDAALENGPLVAETARDLCPFDPKRKSGIHLRDTIRVRRSKSKGIVTVSTDHGKAPHDFLVHNGTIKQPANPFLYKAKDRRDEEYKAGIREKLSA